MLSNVLNGLDIRRLYIVILYDLNNLSRKYPRLVLAKFPGRLPCACQG